MISELPENVFVDAKFKILQFKEGARITQIDANAFTSTAAYIEQISFSDSLHLNNNFVHIRSFFNALSTLSNATRIEIDNSNVSLVPTDTFKVFNGIQSNIQSIGIYDSNISSIGDYAFYELNDIRHIYL